MNQFVSTAENVIAQLLHAGVEARVFGGLAIIAKKLWDRHIGCSRETSDIDIVVGRSDVRVLGRTFRRLGAVVDRSSWLLGAGRLAKVKISNIPVDIFSDPLYLNQCIFIGDNISAEPFALANQDLLLTKLQIEFPKERDILDSAALLLEIYSSSGGLRAATNGKRWDRVVAACHEDWCLEHACRNSITSILSSAKGLGVRRSSRLVEGCADLLANLDESPKSLRWKMRGMQGTLLPTYTPIDG